MALDPEPIEFPFVYSTDGDGEEEFNEFDLGMATANTGQTSNSIVPAVLMDGGGLWTATISNLALVSDDAERAFRAMRTQARGGLVPIIVPRRDVLLPPFPVVDGQPVTSYDRIPFSDGSFFSDGTGFRQSVIVAALTEAALLRATTVKMMFIAGGPLLGGESFSVIDPVHYWRLHEIGSAVVDDDGVWTVDFMPPLRGPLPAGTTVEFDLPRCLMYARDMSLKRQTWPRDKPTIEFVDIFTRPNDARMDLTTAERRAVESGTRALGVFFQLMVDPIQRVWLGVGRIEPGQNSIDPEGVSYSGLGQIVSIPALRLMMNGKAERVDIALSGVSPDVLRLASSEANLVQGAKCYIGLGFMNSRFALLGPVHWIRYGIADYSTIQHTTPQSGSDRASMIKAASSHIVSLSVGSIMTGRRRRGMSYWSDDDEHGRSPGDRGCERTTLYPNGYRKVWPRY